MQELKEDANVMEKLMELGLHQPRYCNVIFLLFYKKPISLQNKFALKKYLCFIHLVNKVWTRGQLSLD